jgi:hypothetical protein
MAGSLSSTPYQMHQKWGDRARLLAFAVLLLYAGIADHIIIRRTWIVVGTASSDHRSSSGWEFSVWPGCSGRYASLSCCAKDRPVPPCTGVRRHAAHPYPRPARRVRGATLTATLWRHTSLRPCRTIHSPAFGRFDEILYLLENPSDLTLPDSVRCDSCRNSDMIPAHLLTTAADRPPVRP